MGNVSRNHYWFLPFHGLTRGPPHVSSSSNLQTSSCSKGMGGAHAVLATLLPSSTSGTPRRTAHGGVRDAKKCRGEGTNWDGDSSCAVCLTEFWNGETLCLLPRCKETAPADALPVSAPKETTLLPRARIGHRRLAFEQRRPCATACRTTPSGKPRPWWCCRGEHDRTSCYVR